MLHLNRIKVVLAEKRRSNNWLAQAVGANYVTVSRWCTNHAQPKLVMLYRIAQVLEVEMGELLRPMNEVEDKED